MSGSVTELDPAAIVEVLNRHAVRFIVIGGVAAQLLDLPVPATIDIDVTPARDRENLERLADAFEELDAGLYTADEGGTWFPRQPIENWAQYDTLHLLTSYGPLDLVFSPEGASGGYEELAPGSVRLSLGEQSVLVIGTAMWEMLKKATGRAKDLAHLDMYYEHREQD